MNAHRHYFNAAGLLAIGAIIYVLFREPVIFTELIHVSPENQPLVPLPDTLWSYALKYVVPDAVWCLALLTFASSMHSRCLKAVAVVIAPGMELGQLAGIIPGTFDIVDLTVYIIITLIFLIKWKRTNTASQPFATA